ncbi:hypothetical protein D3C73_1394670 [compost metagenome]
MQRQQRVELRNQRRLAGYAPQARSRGASGDHYDGQLCDLGQSAFHEKYCVAGSEPKNGRRQRGIEPEEGHHIGADQRPQRAARRLGVEAGCPAAVDPSAVATKRTQHLIGVYHEK